MEALVGLMRGQTRADNYSVELYLKKLDGWNLAMNRLEPRYISLDLAKAHLTNLGKDEVIEAFMDEQHKIFIPFRLLLSRICFMVIYAKEEMHIESRIQEN